MTDGTNFQNTTTNIIDEFTINENYGISSLKVVIPEGIYTNAKLKLMLIKENNDMSYIEHQEQICTIPCQQPMRSIGDVKDTFIKVNGVWYERHYISRILSYNGEEITTAYMSTTGELSTGATVDYALETPLDLPCTQAQTTALEAIQRARTYKNVTHIYSEDEVPPDLEIQYYKEKGE